MKTGKLGAGRTPGVTAFTLIELLVVICIIVILFAILLPALTSAKTSARMCGCISNLHQANSAVFCYVNDFGGYYFPSVSASTFTGIRYDTQGRVVNLLGEYMTVASLHCPAATTPELSGSGALTGNNPFGDPNFFTTYCLRTGRNEYTDYKFTDHARVADHQVSSINANPSWLPLALDMDLSPANIRHGRLLNVLFFDSAVKRFSMEQLNGLDIIGNTPWYNWGVYW